LDRLPHRVCFDQDGFDEVITVPYSISIVRSSGEFVSKTHVFPKSQVPIAHPCSLIACTSDVPALKARSNLHSSPIPSQKRPTSSILPQKPVKRTSPRSASQGPRATGAGWLARMHAFQETEKATERQASIQGIRYHGMYVHPQPRRITAILSTIVPRISLGGYGGTLWYTDLIAVG